jgi:hypothetical protein
LAQILLSFIFFLPKGQAAIETSLGDLHCSSEEGKRGGVQVGPPESGLPPFDCRRVRSPERRARSKVSRARANLARPFPLVISETKVSETKASTTAMHLPPGPLRWERQSATNAIQPSSTWPCTDPHSTKKRKPAFPSENLALLVMASRIACMSQPPLRVTPSTQCRGDSTPAPMTCFPLKTPRKCFPAPHGPGCAFAEGRVLPTRRVGGAAIGPER